MYMKNNTCHSKAVFFRDAFKVNNFVLLWYIKGQFFQNEQLVFLVRYKKCQI